MKRYKQLTLEQRYQIYGLKKAGFDQTEIAVELNVDKGTISRELNPDFPLALVARLIKRLKK